MRSLHDEHPLDHMDSKQVACFGCHTTYPDKYLIHTANGTIECPSCGEEFRECYICSEPVSEWEMVEFPNGADGDIEIAHPRCLGR